MELRNKMSVLQQDLANSEAVQKDFVRLSQSLQVEVTHIGSSKSTRTTNDSFFRFHFADGIRENTCSRYSSSLAGRRRCR